MEWNSGVRRTLGRLALMITLVGVATAACSAPPAASTPDVTVGAAWARPAAAGANSAAYLTITNAGPADTLVSIECTIAGSTMLHQTSTDSSGMTGMSMLGDLPIPSGATVRLDPGGTHVMIGGLKRALVVGDNVELRLVFAHAGEIDVPATIRPG